MDVTYSSDHDTLVRLDENVSGLRQEIKSIKESLDDKTSDHELRLRVLESEKNRIMGATKILYALLTLLALTMGALWWVKA